MCNPSPSSAPSVPEVVEAPQQEEVVEQVISESSESESESESEIEPIIVMQRCEEIREEVFCFLKRRGGVAFLTQLIKESSHYPFSSRLRRTTVKALFIQSFFVILSGTVLNPQKYKWASPSQWRKVRDVYTSPLWWLYWKLQLDSEVGFHSVSRRELHLMLFEMVRRMRAQINHLRLCEEKPPEVMEEGFSDTSSSSDSD